jgi:hypothetical protein
MKRQLPRIGSDSTVDILLIRGWEPHTLAGHVIGFAPFDAKPSFPFLRLRSQSRFPECTELLSAEVKTE